MNEAQHRKQLLIQQIEAHRELMGREVEVLRNANPVTPLIENGRRLLGILRVIDPRHRSRGGSSLAGLRSQVDVELVSATLPVVLQVLRAILRRRDERRARKQQS